MLNGRRPVHNVPMLEFLVLVGCAPRSWSPWIPVEEDVVAQSAATEDTDGG